MSDKDLAATQLGAATGEQEIETADQLTANGKEPAAVLRSEPSERDLAMERIAAHRNKEFQEDKSEEPAATVEAKPEKASDLGVTTQLGKQMEDGTFVLDSSMLDRMMVTTKVNGVEELVPATKALAQYQKGAAADVKLAEAVRMSTEAARLLAEAEARAKIANTPAEKKAADAAVDAAQVDADKVTAGMFDSLYGGDTEAATKAFNEAVKSAVASALKGVPTGAPISVDQVVDAAVPAMKQRIAVDGALDQMVKDYPELQADADLVLVADSKRATLEAQGIPRDQAIAQAGEYIGQKYKIGKFAAKDVPAAGSTTREQKLAAKEGLSEPASTAARAASSLTVAKTPSQIIAEMAEARATAR